MNISEKAAYFKGLVEGLGADKDSREGKLWLTLTDILSDIASEISDLNDTSEDFADTLDEIGDELSYLEEITCDLDIPRPFDSFDDEDFSEDECDGNCEACGLCDLEDEEPGDIVAFSDFTEDTDASADEALPEDEELEYDGVIYDVTCPVCGEEISFEEETLDEGFIICPKCGEKLEFDLSED